MIFIKDIGRSFTSLKKRHSSVFISLASMEISFHVSLKLQLMLHFSNKVKNNALIFVPLHQKDVIKIPISISAVWKNRKFKIIIKDHINILSGWPTTFL